MEDKAMIYGHLLENKSFASALRTEFKDKDSADRILAMIAQAQYDEPTDDLWYEFMEWLSGELQEGLNVLTIGWDSDGWGPGGNGNVRYTARFGIVTATSSDYDDDHWELFDEKNFHPWVPEELTAQSIGLSSKVYNTKQLKDMIGRLHISESTEVSLEGRKGRRRKMD